MRQDNRNRYASNSPDTRDSNRYRGGPPDPVNNRPNDSFQHPPDDDVRMTPGYKQWEELNKQIKEWNSERKEIFHLSFPDKVVIVILMGYSPYY